MENKVMRIIFVRHGDYKGNKLTRLGRKQAMLVCHSLKDENIGRVYCSPIGRTVETANIIVKTLKLDAPIIRKELTEREFLTGEPKNEAESQYAENYLNPSFSSDHPEGCKNFLERSFKFLDEISKLDFESILIVGHSSFSYALTAYFTGVPKDKDLVWVRVGNCSKMCYEVKK